MIDGIKTILNLDDESFNKLIVALNRHDKWYLEKINFFYITDECKLPENIIKLGLEECYDGKKIIDRGDYSDEKFTIYQIFEELLRLTSEFPIKSKEYKRAKKILDSRNLSAFKKMYLNEYIDDNPKILDKAFEIVSSEENLERFLDFENNKEYFSIDNQLIEKREYLKYLTKIFGYVNGKIANYNVLYSEFYIPELEEFKNRCSKIFDSCNIERVVNPMYEFRNLDKLELKAIRKEDEPGWTINPKLYKCIYEELPEYLSLEEKVLYIYNSY